MNTPSFLRVLIALDKCPSRKALTNRAHLSEPQISRCLLALSKLGVKYESVRGIGYRVLDYGAFDIERLKQSLRRGTK